MTFLN